MVRTRHEAYAEPLRTTANQMRVFGTKPFMRFARKFDATDEELWEGMQEQPDADLGGGIFKYRLGREGEGRSGGARLIVAMKQGERVVLMFGFEKRNQANIDARELKAFKRLARSYLERSEQEMNKLLLLGELVEVGKPATHRGGKRKA